MKINEGGSFSPVSDSGGEEMQEFFKKFKKSVKERIIQKKADTFMPDIVFRSPAEAEFCRGKIVARENTANGYVILDQRGVPVAEDDPHKLISRLKELGHKDAVMIFLPAKEQIFGAHQYLEEMEKIGGSDE